MPDHLNGLATKFKTVPVFPVLNPNTERAYEHAVKDFMLFTGIKRPEEFRLVTPAHVITWRDDLGERTLGGTTIGAHALRAMAATNALDHEADIAKVQDWLGHANISTTRIYDHRKSKPEDSPTFKITY